MPIERKNNKKTKLKFQEKRESGAKEAGGGRQSKDVKELSFDELLALHKSERNKSTETPSSDDSKGSSEKGESGRQVLEARRDRKMKTSNKRLYLPLSSQAEVQRRVNTAEDCRSIFQHYQKIEKNKAVECSNGDVNSSENDDRLDNHLGFFMTREAMRNLLGKSLTWKSKDLPSLYSEAEVAGQADDLEARTVVSIWSGDLDTAVEEAIRTGSVTERMLSHCAGVSQRLWRRAAAAAGRQFVREGEVNRGAEYLVSAGEVLEAVTVLSKNGHHRAAVAIARSRLPLESEAVRQTMKNWALQCQNDGNYSLAAKCWLSIGMYGEASELLAKLSSGEGDEDCLRLAALVTPDKAKANIYRRQCLAVCMERSDQSLALQIIEVGQPSF